MSNTSMQRKFLGHQELNDYLKDNNAWVYVAGELLQLKRVSESNKRLVLHYGDGNGQYQLTLKRGRLNLPDRRPKLPQLTMHDDDDEIFTLYFPKDNLMPHISNFDENEWDD